MEILSRSEFARILTGPVLPRNLDTLWIPESDLGLTNKNPVVCVHFIRVKPVDTGIGEFWDWCDSTLEGQCRCFASDGHDQEWWGFTVQQDILIWTLKWVT